jgi:hypothetical protein
MYGDNQRGGGNRGTTFAAAKGIFQSNAKTLAKKNFRQPCENDFALLGTNGADVRLGAANVNIQNGTNSSVLKADLYANTTLYAAAQAQFGATTVGQYQQLNPGTVAQAELKGNDIYINSSLIDPYAYYQNLGVTLHEILHNVTGLTDPDIQTKFFGKSGGLSDDITQKLIKDCL